MGALVTLAWPETLVRSAGSWYDIVLGFFGLQTEGGFYRSGHGGVLLISQETGHVHYLDYGRYESAPGTGRIRDESTDPELKVSAKAVFCRDGMIKNIEEILLEVSRNPSTHGRGPMVAALLRGIDFKRAYRSVKRQQTEGMLAYGHFSPGKTDCGRFVARLACFSRPPLAARLAMAFSRAWGPSPLFLARSFNDTGFVYMGKEGKIFLKRPWSVLRCRKSRISAPTPEEARGEGSMLPPVRRPELPSQTQWLSGAAFGKWIALTQEPRLGSGEYRFRRYSSSACMECDRVFAVKETGAFDIEKPFRFDYPTHCSSCVLRQEGRIIHLESVRDFKGD